MPDCPAVFYRVNLCKRHVQVLEDSQVKNDQNRDILGGNVRLLRVRGEELQLFHRVDQSCSMPGDVSPVSKPANIGGESLFLGTVIFHQFFQRSSQPHATQGGRRF